MTTPKVTTAKSKVTTPAVSNNEALATMIQSKVDGLIERFDKDGSINAIFTGSPEGISLLVKIGDASVFTGTVASGDLKTDLETVGAVVKEKLLPLLPLLTLAATQAKVIAQQVMAVYGDIDSPAVDAAITDSVVATPEVEVSTVTESDIDTSEVLPLFVVSDNRDTWTELQVECATQLGLADPITPVADAA